MKLQGSQHFRLGCSQIRYEHCVNNAHDTFVKDLFSRPEVAAEHFWELLPPGAAAAVTWPTLRFENGVTVDAFGKELRADWVFSVQTTRRRRMLLCLHLEHQRGQERFMAVRMAEYRIRIWWSWVRLQKGQGGSPTHLPPVFSTVLHNGPGVWRAPTRLEDLLERHPDLDVSEHDLRGYFPVVDLSSTPDADLASAMRNAHLRLGLLLLKHIDAPDIWERVVSWSQVWREVAQLDEGIDRLRAVLSYLGDMVGQPPEPVLRRLVDRLPEPSKEFVMTWADSLREEGEQVGLERGRHEGLQSARRVLLQLLRIQFGQLPASVEARVGEATLDEVERWAASAPDAGSLAALLDA